MRNEKKKKRIQEDKLINDASVYRQEEEGDVENELSPAWKVPHRANRPIQATRFCIRQYCRAYDRRRWRSYIFLLIALIFSVNLLSICFRSEYLPPIRDLFDRISSKPCQRNDYACHIDLARENMQKLIRKQSTTVEEAIQNYKTRYSRNPPPRFEDWVQYALDHNATLIDEYDQIEADLAPFRSAQLTRAEAMRLMNQAAEASQSIKLSGQVDDRIGWVHIRNGISNITSAAKGPMSAKTVREIIDPIAERLPDLDILYSFVATGRVMTRPEEYRSRIKTRNLSHKPSVDYLQSFCQNDRISKGPLSKFRTKLNLCKPDAKERLEKLHGFFAMPDYFHPFEGGLVPIISRAKLSIMSDILAANPCYASGSYRQWSSPDHIPYDEKHTSIFWKGTSTGIWINQPEEWNLGHRQRFVNVIQSMKQKAQEQEKDHFRSDLYDPEKTNFAPDSFDVAFTRVTNCRGVSCEQFKEQFRIVDRDKPISGYRHKIVADIDGEGMSCRFYRQIGSNSLPLKQTIWAEWHDDRIMPWLHFIPLSLEMDELEELLQWLLYDSNGMKYAKLVANEGADWARRSLRLEDITIHHYRLLLEYANVIR